MNDNRDVETYCVHGVWKNRRHDCDQAFSTGSSRVQQIAMGAEAARWNQAYHIIRDRSGVVVETNDYRSGSHSRAGSRTPPHPGAPNGPERRVPTSQPPQVRWRTASLHE
jgi:hypothetical protein